jgi:ferredoxin
MFGAALSISASTTAKEDLGHGEFEKIAPSSPDQIVNLVLVDRKGAKYSVQGKIGDNLLYLCHKLREEKPELYLEGACEASLACSTCHVILSDKFYHKLNQLKPPCDKEEDMLDQASCLTPTSRLGCQIILSKELDGMEVTLPAFSRNFYVDGHVPTPH